MDLGSQVQRAHLQGANLSRCRRTGPDIKGAAVWRDGKLTPGDFVGMKESKEWGRSVYVRSLKGAKAAAESTSLLSGNMSAFPRNRSYQLDYRDTATGAKVVYPDGWKPSNSYEIPTARALAQNGIDVVLRQPVNETEGDPSTTGIKSPDALLKVAGKWQAFDFKAINSETVNIKTAAQRMTRAARNQGGSAVIYLARNLDSGESVNDINRGIIAALSHDQPPRIRTLILLDADGKMQMKERDDFYDTGNGFSEFRGSN